jgi:hypothetical protein
VSRATNSRYWPSLYIHRICWRVSVVKPAFRDLYGAAAVWPIST